MPRAVHCNHKLYWSDSRTFYYLIRARRIIWMSYSQSHSRYGCCHNWAVFPTPLYHLPSDVSAVKLEGHYWCRSGQHTFIGSAILLLNHCVKFLRLWLVIIFFDWTNSVFIFLVRFFGFNKLPKTEKKTAGSSLLLGAWVCWPRDPAAVLLLMLLGVLSLLTADWVLLSLRLQQCCDCLLLTAAGLKSLKQHFLIHKNEKSTNSCAYFVFFKIVKLWRKYNKLIKITKLIRLELFPKLSLHCIVHSGIQNCNIEQKSKTAKEFVELWRFNIIFLIETKAF